MNNITVPVSEVLKLKKKIDKINTQCQRHNLDKVTLVQSEPYLKTFTKTVALIKDGTYSTGCSDPLLSKPKEITKKVVDLKVSGEAPVVNQYYKVIGFVENGNSKGEKIIELWDKSSQWTFSYEAIQKIKNCNHCNTKRNRNKIYIIEDLKADKLVNVGSTCINQYFNKNLESLLQQFSDLGNEFELLTDYNPPESDNWAFPAKQYDVEKVLESSAAIIRIYKWLSVGKANGKTTTKQRLEYYLGVYKDKTNINDKPIKITNEDKDLAKKAHKWITGLNTNNIDNDYINNLYVACSQEKITSKLFGIACSLFVGYKYNNKEK